MARVKDEAYYAGLLEGVDRYADNSKRDNFTQSRNAYLNKRFATYDDWEIAVYGEKKGTVTDLNYRDVS